MHILISKFNMKMVEAKGLLLAFKVLCLILSSQASFENEFAFHGHYKVNDELRPCVFQEEFDRDDEDGDGFLTAYELCRSLMRQRKDINPERCREVFLYWDLDKDRRITCHGKIPL